MFCLAVLTQYRRVTDERTDRRTSCDNIISRRERNLEVRSASARHWAETTAHKRHFRRHSFIAKHRELSTPHKWVFNPQSFQDPLIFALPLPDIRYSTSGSSLVDTRKYFLRCMQHYTKNHLDPHELIYTPPNFKIPYRENRREKALWDKDHMQRVFVTQCRPKHVMPTEATFRPLTEFMTSWICMTSGAQLYSPHTTQVISRSAIEIVVPSVCLSVCLSVSDALELRVNT